MHYGSEAQTTLHPLQHAASLYERGYKVWIHGKNWFQVNKHGDRLYVPEASYRLLKAMENQDAECCSTK